MEVDGYRVTFAVGDVGEEGYELVDLETGAAVGSETVDASAPQFDPDDPFEHAFERDGDLVFLDPVSGEELLVVQRMAMVEAFAAANDEAYEESGYDPEAEYVPDRWLAASRDGTTWLVEDLPESEDGGSWFGGPVLGAPGVLVPEADGWTLVPFP